MNRYIIQIPRWRPTALNAANRMHWAVRDKRKKADAAMIKAYATDIPDARGKRRVSINIILTGKQKKADPDAYWKNVLDGLVRCKKLIDDTVDYVELGTVTYGRLAGKGWHGTMLILEDIV